MAANFFSMSITFGGETVMVRRMLVNKPQSYWLERSRCRALEHDHDDVAVEHLPQG